ASVVHAAADLQLVWQIALVTPKSASGARINGEGPVVLARAVDHAVHHERRRLELPEIAHLERPPHRQMSGVVHVDLVERAVAPTGIASRIREPVLRL